MLVSLLLLGFVIGMQHAFEADHLAAVSTLVSRRRGLFDISMQGAIWGLGHATALLVFTAIVLLTRVVPPPWVGELLEALVGVLLVVLGSHLLWRLWRDRVHIHAHQHDDGTLHFHGHSHRGEAVRHESSPHRHAHRVWNGALESWRAGLVGLAHGAAGSAALTVYVATTLESPASGFLYVLVFGMGSMLGMFLLTAIIAVPLSVTARTLTWTNRGLQVVIGAVTVAIGLYLTIMRAAPMFGP